MRSHGTQGFRQRKVSSSKRSEGLAFERVERTSDPSARRSGVGAETTCSRNRENRKMSSGNASGDHHNRWICPNDRVLTFRAKLDAGWSNRSTAVNNLRRSVSPSISPYASTSNLSIASSASCADVGAVSMAAAAVGASTTSSISEEEQEKILRVISRAQRVEEAERERIQRMTDRLQNMKRNSTGNGRDNCGLCGEKLRFFSLKTSSFDCEECSKLVCSKCVVDHINPADKSITFFCKICSETREIWKKSGAWFLKALPTFPLVTSSSPPRCVSPSSTTSFYPNQQTYYLRPESPASPTNSVNSFDSCMTRSSLSTNVPATQLPSSLPASPSTRHKLHLYLSRRTKLIRTRRISRKGRESGPMFRIVENTDGSTSILDRMSGKLLTVIPAKHRNSCNRIPQPPPLTPGPKSTCSGDVSAEEKTRDETTSADVRANTGSRAAVSGEPVRRLRPRNVQPEYNEDRAFEALIHPTTGILSMPFPEASDARVRKPDHLVVVYKHSAERQAETPNRMRLLPAVTLNKLQAGLHQPKAGAAAPAAGSFLSEAPEPENDCIDLTTYCQYLDLIPTPAVMRRNSSELKHKWPLRLHARTSLSSRSKHSIPSQNMSQVLHPPNSSHNSQLSQGSKSALTELQARSEAEKNMWVNSLKSKERFVTSQKTPQNVLHCDPNGVLHLIPSFAGLGENGNLYKQSHIYRKQSSGSSCSGSDLRTCPPHDRDLFNCLPTQSPCDHMKSDQRKMMLKRFVRKFMLQQAEKYKAGMEMSSPLGKRLADAYATIVNLHSTPEVLRLIKSFERHCSTSAITHRQLLQAIKSPFSPKVRIEFGIPSPSKSNFLTTRVLRSQLTVSATSNAWGLKSYHIFPFSKQERMEKSLTMSSGLDWKARLLALHCEDISLHVQELPLTNDSSRLLSTSTQQQLFNETVVDPHHEPYVRQPIDVPIISLDDSLDEVCLPNISHDENQMILCDEDYDDMEIAENEEEEEVILIGGPSAMSPMSDPTSRPETSSNFHAVSSSRSPAELLIEF